MKKFLSVFIILLFLNSLVFAGKSEQINVFFPMGEAIDKLKNTSGEEETDGLKKEKKKKKWFSFKKKEKKKKDEEEIQRGYYGTLPDINDEFKYKRQEVKPSYNMNMKTFDETDEQNLKEAPFNDTLFLDKIIKKEPKSTYVNDLVKIKFSLENLKKCIEENRNIQRFNASVNVIDLQCQNFENKYKKTSNSFKESYKAILMTNYHAKILGNLKYNANYYARYVPISDGQYSKNNISLQEKKLLTELNKTLYIIIKEMGL